MLLSLQVRKFQRYPTKQRTSERILEKYDGENFIIFEVYQNKLDERKKITKTLKRQAS